MFNATCYKPARFHALGLWRIADYTLEFALMQLSHESIRSGSAVPIDFLVFWPDSVVCCSN